MTRTIALAVFLVASIAAASAQAGEQPRANASVVQLFRRFWEAATREEAAQAADAVVKSGASYEQAHASLTTRSYSADVPRGIVRGSHRIGDREFVYTIEVPETYDPARRYQARVQLHGGVMRSDGSVRGSGGIGSLVGAEQIYIIPNSWRDAPWWSAVQIENLRVILGRVKRKYNVDENRIALAGVSDGGTAAYYVAMRDPTPYASFLPLNGFLMVLASPSLELVEDLHPHNLRNRPFFVVNGGRDPLYPAAQIEPYVRHLERRGVTVAYQARPEAGHNTAWWPEVKESFEAFVRDHPRAPHSASLTWETDDPVSSGRAGWLVIDKLGSAGGRTPLEDLNEITAGSESNFGVRVAGMRITSVLPGTNADRFGFKPGDVVVRVNDRTLPRGLDLLEFLAIYDLGTRLTFLVSRDNKPVELTGVFPPTTIARVRPLFEHSRPSGRVDLVREGNTVRATTRGVAEFTLLLSPEVFDFDRPITVTADGRTVSSRRVTKSVATLMKWAARDLDRTMLYGAELTVKVK